MVKVEVEDNLDNESNPKTRTDREATEHGVTMLKDEWIMN